MGSDKKYIYRICVWLTLKTKSAYSICYSYGVNALQMGPDYSLHVQCRLRIWFNTKISGQAVVHKS